MNKTPSSLRTFPWWYRSGIVIAVAFVVLAVAGLAIWIHPIKAAQNAAVLNSACPGNSSGVSPLLFGTNLGLYNAGDPFLTDGNLRNVMHSQLHNQIVRVPARPEDNPPGYPTLTQALKDIAALNMEAVVVLHAEGAVSANDLSDDSAVVKIAASIFGNKSVIFEFGNEQSLAGVSTQAYTSAWNTVVPTLKTLDAYACFAGPIHYQYDSSDDANYLTYFLTNANPKPDYVDWHQYVCSSATTSQADCLSALTARLNQSIAPVGTANPFPSVPQVMQQTGVVRPMIITEWNYDPQAGGQKYNDDASFMQQFTDETLEGFASHGVYAAMQFWVNGLTPLVNSDDTLTLQGQDFQAEYAKLIGNKATSSPTPGTTVTPVAPTPTVATQTPTPIATNTPPSTRPTVTATPQPTGNSGAPDISFDHGTAGWAPSISDNRDLTVVGTTANPAPLPKGVNGSAKALKVTYNSFSVGDYPEVVDSNEAVMPRGGQTVTAYVYLASGTNTRAWLFVQDTHYEWYGKGANSDVTLKAGAWNKLTFTIPASLGNNVSRLGIQFFGYNATVYIDGINWT